MPVYNLDISPPTLQVTGDPIWSPLAMGLSKAVADIWRANRENVRAENEIAADKARRSYESDEWKRREDLRLENELKLIEARSKTRTDKPNIRVLPGEFGAPPTAVRINPDGTLTQVPIAPLGQSKPGVAPPVAPGAAGATPVPGVGKEPVAPAPGQPAPAPATGQSDLSLPVKTGLGVGAGMASSYLTKGAVEAARKVGDVGWKSLASVLLSNPVARTVASTLPAVGTGALINGDGGEYSSTWGDLAAGAGAEAALSFAPGGRIIAPVAGLAMPAVASTVRKGVATGVMGGYDPSTSKIQWGARQHGPKDPDYVGVPATRLTTFGEPETVEVAEFTPSGAARHAGLLRQVAAESSSYDFPKNAALAVAGTITGLTADETKSVHDYASLLLDTTQPGAGAKWAMGEHTLWNPLTWASTQNPVMEQVPAAVRVAQKRHEEGMYLQRGEGGKRTWQASSSPEYSDAINRVRSVFEQAKTDPSAVREKLLRIAGALIPGGG